MIADAPTRPVLRYHGGKFRIAHWIIGNMPAHRCYVEPYGGGASVLMQKPRAYAEVYNDLDDRIVNVFRVLRDPAQAKELHRLLELTAFARTEFLEARDRAEDDIEDARRIITLAFLGFSSDAATRPCGAGFRANNKRSGTTPAHDWIRYPACLQAFTERLRGVIIENRDALEVIRIYDSPDTLFYIDPPYVKSTRMAVASHQRCYRHEMTDDDHIKLAEALHSISGMVMLSGYACRLYEELYADWACITKGAHTHAARPRTECLWFSPNIKPVQMTLEGSTS